mmetsp:Transcript_21887/g.51621  ORF Transcript_21887/g.51621 Transcript_21887/m.51621 type:complete len:137 (+) Transcript_21887:108-518(+)
MATTTMPVIVVIFFLGLVSLVQSTFATGNNAARLGSVTAFTAPTTTTSTPSFIPVVGRRNNNHHASATATGLSAAASSAETPPPPPDMDDVGFVVLAGGTGSRMKANMRTYSSSKHSKCVYALNWGGMQMEMLYER